MATVLINGQEVEIGDDERLNGIQAAARIDVDVPHYCWHPGLSVVASCRMCLVEVGRKDPETGEISMMPRLAPACQTPAKDGTVFVTNSDKVRQSRAMVEEYLLMDHPIDCPICDKAGECYLQDYHFQHGQKERRFDVKPFHSRRRDIGPTVTLFVDRCVMCSRCVRFCREVSGSSELMVIQRGQKEEIDVFRDEQGQILRPLENELSGNVVDLCPVGALGDRDFLYSQRVWYMKRHAGICTGCSTGCSIFIEENQDQVYRLKPRENPHVNQWWMCDHGRYGFHYVNHEDRLNTPWKRTDQQWSSIDWSVILAELPSKLSQTLQEQPQTAPEGQSHAPAAGGRLAVCISPHATVEEAYLLAKIARSFDEQVVLALGPVPTVGEDKTFSAGFTIRAEKAPNRRGVTEVLNHFGGGISFGELAERAATGEFAALWVSAGYPSVDWIDQQTADQLAQAKLLIVSDLFSTRLSAQADYVLPATSFAEKDGSYVNSQAHLQSARWAVRPRQGIRSEGSTYQHLLGKKGLYRASLVLEEIAQTIDFFAPAKDGLPEVGLSLEPAAVASLT